MKFFLQNPIMFLLCITREYFFSYIDDERLFIVSPRRSFLSQDYPTISISKRSLPLSNVLDQTFFTTI